MASRSKGFGEICARKGCGEVIVDPMALTDLEREARHLATYAASINWQPGDNTREWLLGLRDLIEHVQALTAPNEGEMSMDDHSLDHLDDDGGCPMCGGTGELAHDCGEDTCCCLDKDGPVCPRCGGMG